MSFDIIRIFQEMGLVDRLVSGLLALFCVLSVGVFLERLWTLGRSNRASKTFARDAAELLDRGAITELTTTSGTGGHLGRLVGAGLRTYSRAAVRPGELSAAELARRELERETEGIDADLRRGLSMLASIGSVAPFVGLLGTVFGIIHAFSSISEQGSGGLGVVSGSIAQALVVTAFGLVVAIPAVLMFNHLSTRVDGLMRELVRARGELVDHLESRPARALTSVREASDASAA